MESFIKLSYWMFTDIGFRIPSLWFFHCVLYIFVYLPIRLLETWENLEPHKPDSKVLFLDSWVMDNTLSRLQVSYILVDIRKEDQHIWKSLKITFKVQWISFGHSGKLYCTFPKIISKSHSKELFLTKISRGHFCNFCEGYLIDLINHFNHKLKKSIVHNRAQVDF